MHNLYDPKIPAIQRFCHYDTHLINREDLMDDTGERRVAEGVFIIFLLSPARYPQPDSSEAALHTRHVANSTGRAHGGVAAYCDHSNSFSTDTPHIDYCT